MRNESGVLLICSNPDCGCKLRIEQPCPHGDTYQCACGHPLQEASADGVDADEAQDAIRQVDEAMDMPGGVRP